MKFKIRITALIIVVLQILLSAVTVSADDTDSLPPVPPLEKCKAAYLYNFENDTALFEYNPTEIVYPASTVKLMTAIVAFDYFEGALDTEITVTREMLGEVAGNKIGFYDGEIVTVRQMLNCMLVNSANDAAIILAHATAGDTASFVRMMNEKAAWIGAYNTYYMNPTGLHDDLMVTTAADTALIAKYAYNIPEFIDITATSKYVMDATNKSDYRSIYNRNCLISKFYSVDYYYSDAIGMNAGATTQGGYTLCAVAEDEERGLTYLAVVLGAEKDEDGKLYSYINGTNMLKWAFEAYDYAQVLSSSKIICELPVTLSSTLDYVTLVPQNDITVYLPKSIDLQKDIRYSYNTYSDSLEAPVEAGAIAGSITVLYGDEILGSCPLITTSSITRSEFLHFLEGIKQFTKSRFFISTIIAIVVLSVAYVLIQARRREQKLRRMSGRR
ncbi:MAG: D-alanyl-D-alanine carboxypeptidase [Ruminococcaceae bacterium]|nr:D-alanyl-D-alanine carboxypeptidase [Oscillospiraceae bacterium]